MPSRRSLALSEQAQRFSIVFKNSARKDLARFDKRTQQKIADAISTLASNPHPHGSLKLSGFEDYWRIRIGSYRVVYQIRDNELIIFIIRIADRKDVYQGL